MVNEHTRYAPPLSTPLFPRLAVAELNTRDLTPMYIPQDVVDLIIDQLVLTMAEVYARERRRCLQATSLVSTVWVNPSQRHLFSTVEFDNDVSVRGWCERIEPDPCGISRHVRVLRLCERPLSSGILDTAVPHLTSFRNLEELNMDWGSRTEKIDIDCAPLNVLTHIFSSFSGTLKRLGWTQTSITQGNWRVLYVLINHLPNLIDLDLLGFHHDPLLPPVLPRIRLYGYELPDPSAFDHFKFRILEVVDTIYPSSLFLKHCQIHLQVLDFWGFDCRSRNYENFPVFFEACHALQEISFNFDSYIGQILGSIPSSSVSLIRLCDPQGITGTTYNSCWGHPLRVFQHYRDGLEQLETEYAKLGVSIRKIAQGFSDHHHGLKTRVQVIYQPTEQEAQAIDNGEIPFFMTTLEEELGTYVTLELITS